MADGAKGTAADPGRPTFFASKSSGWVFCLAIVILKFVLLAFDSSPKFYLGDSISYIWTALTGWIPDDRSYFYGFVIRWSALWTHSFVSLLVVQTLLGCVVAIVVAWVCRVIVDLPERVAYLFGFLSAIDPLEMTWERYVMTETCSLFFYALVLQQSFVYLRDRRLTTLILVQFLAVMTLGFRMVFLIPLQILAMVLPLIAFLWPNQRSQIAAAAVPHRLSFLRQAIFWQHLAVSLAAMIVLDQGYQRAYGFLTHRQPAHLHAAGYFLLALCAPALQPEDATDPRLAKIIEQGDEFGLRDFSLRNDQRFIKGHLISRWRQLERDPVKSSKIAGETAFRAIRRDPAAFIGFAARTYFILWRPHEMKRFAQWDLNPDGKLNEAQVKYLSEQFHWTGRADVGSEPRTFTQSYYLMATPWFFLPMISPLLVLLLLFVAQNKAHAWLLFMHTNMIFAVTFLFSTGPFTRYLQPLSLLTLLSIALALKSFLSPRSGYFKGLRECFSGMRRAVRVS
jgi:hypothetical protein